MGEKGADFVAAFGKTASDYTYTDCLTDTDWAWEFLRLSPAYRNDYIESYAKLTRGIIHPSGIKIYRARGRHDKARTWGLSAFTEPGLNAQETHVFWSQDTLSYSVLAASSRVPAPGKESDFDLFQDENCCAILCDEHYQKIILRSRNAALDMKLAGANVLFSPVILQFHLEGFAKISSGTKALIWTQNALKSELTGDKKPLTRAAKMHRKKCLIALECDLRGASLRDIGNVFRAYGLTRLSWSSSGDEALKKQVWRCRNMGLKLMQGGYKKFL